MGYGVIGNTTDSGPVIPGSSPGIPTKSNPLSNCIQYLADCFFMSTDVSSILDGGHGVGPLTLSNVADIILYNNNGFR